MPIWYLFVFFFFYFLAKLPIWYLIYASRPHCSLFTIQGDEARMRYTNLWEAQYGIYMHSWILQKIHSIEMCIRLVIHGSIISKIMDESSPSQLHFISHECYEKIIYFFLFSKCSNKQYCWFSLKYTSFVEYIYIYIYIKSKIQPRTFSMTFAPNDISI